MQPHTKPELSMDDVVMPAMLRAMWGCIHQRDGQDRHEFDAEFRAFVRAVYELHKAMSTREWPAAGELVTHADFEVSPFKELSEHLRPRYVPGSQCSYGMLYSWAMELVRRLRAGLAEVYEQNICVR